MNYSSTHNKTILNDVYHFYRIQLPISFSQIKTLTQSLSMTSVKCNNTILRKVQSCFHKIYYLFHLRYIFLQYLCSVKSQSFRYDISQHKFYSLYPRITGFAI